jgi:hypothetical protein
MPHESSRHAARSHQPQRSWGCASCRVMPPHTSSHTSPPGRISSHIKSLTLPGLQPGPCLQASAAGGPMGPGATQSLLPPGASAPPSEQQPPTTCAALPCLLQSVPRTFPVPGVATRTDHTGRGRGAMRRRPQTKAAPKVGAACCSALPRAIALPAWLQSAAGPTLSNPLSESNALHCK